MGQLSQAVALHEFLERLAFHAIRSISATSY